MAATITLSDIQAFAQITINIDSRLIDYQITAARSLNIDALLGDTLMDAIDDAFSDSATYPETFAFFNDYVKPYWCLTAYSRFLGVHGTNITQFGVTNTNDPRGTFNQASDQQRANMLRQAEGDRKIYKQKLVDRLEAVSFTFDGVVYSEQDSLERSNDYVRAIRKKEKRSFEGRRLNRFNEFLP